MDDLRVGEFLKNLSGMIYGFDQTADGPVRLYLSDMVRAGQLVGVYFVPSFNPGL